MEMLAEEDSCTDGTSHPTHVTQTSHTKLLYQYVDT